MSIYIKKQLQERLNEQFKDYNIDWINVTVVNSKIIDVKLVSEKLIERKELLNFVNNFINQENEKLHSHYISGIIRNYDFEESLELKLEKPKENTDKINLDEVSFKELSNYMNNNEIIKPESANKIISFYSYKGGVGRTVALIQTAYELSKAGKKVLLIDLDLEAPSFNSIFRDSISKEYGIVDYLHEKMYGTEKKVKINDIISKINGLKNGEIYFVHAGKLSKSYVNKLGDLKEKRIYENQYIKNLIEEIRAQYGIDYTFVDSRTGINDWGALSLIDICDEVFLFAYPNRENIEGIKLINDIIKDYKNSTIVLSRIDSSDDGKNKAIKLFKELNLTQEPIFLYYDKNLALADSFPVQNLFEYSVISDFVLEKEKGLELAKILKNKKDDIKDILRNIIDISDIKNICTTYERKTENKNNFLIICNYDIFDKYIINILNSHPLIEITCEDENGKIASELRNEINSKITECQDIETEKIFSLIILYITEIIKIKLGDKIENTSKNIDIESRKNNLSIIYSLADISKGNNIHCLLKLENILNILSGINLMGISDIEVGLIINSIVALNHNYNINFKLVASSDEYINYSSEFDINNTNMLKLDWKLISKTDKDFVINEIGEYVKEIFEGKVGFKLSKLDKSIFNKNFETEIDYFIDAIFEGFERTAFNIVYGERLNYDAYSKKTTEYIYNYLESKNRLNQDGLLKFIKDSAQNELDNFESKTDYSRIICLKNKK